MCGAREHGEKAATPGANLSYEERPSIMEQVPLTSRHPEGAHRVLQAMNANREYLKRQEGFGRHLLTNSGFADDAWFYRTFWRLGYGDARDFPFSYLKHGFQVPFGQLLVFDDRVVCGLQTFMSPGTECLMAEKAVPRSRAYCWSSLVSIP